MINAVSPPLFDASDLIRLDLQVILLRSVLQGVVRGCGCGEYDHETGGAGIASCYSPAYCQLTCLYGDILCLSLVHMYEVVHME